MALAVARQELLVGLSWSVCRVKASALVDCKPRVIPAECSHRSNRNPLTPSAASLLLQYLIWRVQLHADNFHLGAGSTSERRDVLSHDKVKRFDREPCPAAGLKDRGRPN